MKKLLLILLCLPMIGFGQESKTIYYNNKSGGEWKSCKKKDTNFYREIKFDDKGNFIGINSSGLDVKVVDNIGYSIKSSYLLNLIDVLPEITPLPSSNQLVSKPLTEQIKILSNYVVLIKAK